MALVLLVLTVAFSYEQISRVVADKSFSPEGELLDVGGHSLHLLRKGNMGPTVVFESGLDGFGHLSWYKVEAEVSRFATTVSYDRAGILWSERGNAPKTAAAMGKDLSTLLERGGFNKPYILVGHSLAGIILRPFIAKNARDIGGVVLVDASHPDQFNRFPSEMNQTPARWAMNLIASFGLMRLTAPSTFPNSNTEDRINTAGIALIHISANAVFDELRNIQSLAEEANAITSFGNIPVVVITGASPTRNDTTPSEFREDMARIWTELQTDLLTLSTDSQQILAMESGHYVQVDQPEIVTAAIRELVERTENVALRIE